MSTQQIIERIRADALAEAQAIVADAEEKAAKLRAESEERITAMEQEARNEAEERRAVILEKKAATARLDSAKLLLREKRKVINTVYDEALSRLMDLNKEDSVALVARLLEAYAEEGDEVYFSKNFTYEEEVKLLPVFEEKKLRISTEKLPIEGGVRLKGEKADKDLSYTALLNADREEYQAELAKKIFR